MTQPPPVTVAIARFEDLLSRGLRSLLGEDESLQVVADDVDYDALDAVLREVTPRVAILNFGSLRTPIEVHRLHRGHPETRLLILASRPSLAECNQMLAFGATGCLSKETQARDVLSAIHLASRGLQVLPRTSSSTDAPVPVGPELLTPREADILDHLRQGSSNAEIAQELHVSVETVRTHRRHIYRKLGVTSRRELAGL
jgi:DNA-binding NarL/FixJ family response regulator